MSHTQFSGPSRPRDFRGSLLLASAGRRLLAALLVSACLWGLTAWALGWW